MGPTEEVQAAGSSCPTCRERYPATTSFCPKDGARLVQETGAVLASISEQIVTVSHHVEMMATASRDQATALNEVNGSVNQMDQMTQQNAAMVETTTVACRQLASRVLRHARQRQLGRHPQGPVRMPDDDGRDPDPEARRESHLSGR